MVVHLSNPVITPSSPSGQPDLLPGLSPGIEPTILLDRVSKWYGDIVAVSDVSFGVGPGVTALLGPNGAGKSTVLKMIAGLISSSSGTVTITGFDVRGRPAVYRHVGLVTEHDDVYPFLTGFEFVRFNALLHRLDRASQRTWQAIRLVDMEDNAHRAIGEFSKGMRQRIKVAAALVHEPEFLLLDEPMNGMDPLQRNRLIDLLRQLAAEGKTVLVSSHVLGEVQRFAENILVIINGKLAAAGDYRTIRARMDQHDHVIRIESDAPRRLAAALATEQGVKAIQFDKGQRLTIETSDVRQLYRLVPQLARQHGIRLLGITPGDESLQSVFAYLTER